MLGPFQLYYDSNFTKSIPDNSRFDFDECQPGIDKTISIYVKNTINFNTELDIEKPNDGDITIDMVPLQLGPHQSGKFKIKFSPRIDRLAPLLSMANLKWKTIPGTGF